MKILIKHIKYFIINNEYYLYLKFFIKLILQRKIIYYSKKIHKIKSLGGFVTKINLFNIDELISLFHGVDYILGFKYFIFSRSKIYIYSSKSNLIYNFFSKTLNCKTYVLDENFLKMFKKNKNLILLNKNEFIKQINKEKSSNIILYNEYKIITKNNIDLSKFDIILSKKKLILKRLNIYAYDKFGKINFKVNNLYNKYYLYSKSELIKKKNNKNLISGIACLKNLDIFPFDICFESALSIVDELYIGVDIKSYNSKYKKLLNKFLKETKYRKKIKLKFFDFKVETANNLVTRGRWIADVFNILANETNNNHLMICGADELFQFDLNNKLTKKFIHRYDEIILNFIHFVYNFNFIRDPKFTSYNTWHRIVKSNKYISNHDGMGFKKNDYIYPKKKKINFNVFHLGYVLNYQKKIKEHLNKKSGLFGNLYSEKKYIQSIKPIKVQKNFKENLLKTLEKYNYMSGYKELIKFK